MAGIFDWSGVGAAMPEAYGANVPIQDPLAKALLGVMKTGASAATLPGDVYAGRVDPTSPEGIARAADLVGMVTLGAGAMPAEANAVRTGMSFPLFHGSPKAGLKEILPSERGALGPGAYFTPADNVAARYGENVYQLPEKNRDIFNGLGDRYGSYEDWKADKQRLMNAVEPEKAAELEAILDKMWTNDGYPMHSRIAGMYRDEGKAQDLYKRAGFEGIAGHADGPEVALFGSQSLTPPSPSIRAYHGSPHDFDRFAGAVQQPSNADIVSAIRGQSGQ